MKGRELDYPEPECRECRELEKRIPEYLAGSLTPAETAEFAAHLAGCAVCSAQVAVFRDLDLLLSAAAPEIPPVDLTVPIMEKIRMIPVKGDSRRKRRIFSVAQDLVAAAAVAIIMFWFSGPVLAGSALPNYAPNVLKVTGYIGGAVETYVDVSVTTMGKFSGYLNQIDQQMKGITQQMKGDEHFELP